MPRRPVVVKSIVPLSVLCEQCSDQVWAIVSSSHVGRVAAQFAEVRLDRLHLGEATGRAARPGSASSSPSSSRSRERHGDELERVRRAEREVIGRQRPDRRPARWRRWPAPCGRARRGRRRRVRASRSSGGRCGPPSTGDAEVAWRHRGRSAATGSMTPGLSSTV